MFRNLIDRLDQINESADINLIGFIDEYADGDLWIIKVPANISRQFLLLANSIEDASLVGTEYEPNQGIMSIIHKKINPNDQSPQWTTIQGPIPNDVQAELLKINPVPSNLISKLQRADDPSEFMSELLWDLEAKQMAVHVVTDSARYSGNQIIFSNDSTEPSIEPSPTRH